jgi:hypothetical protein
MPYLFSLTILSIIIATILVIGTYRTYQIQTQPEQKIFFSGKIPTKAPDGIYKGSVKNFKTNWIGKSFNAKESTGINNFKQDETIVLKKYPFKTYIGQGIQDTNKDVLKIDYNIDSNPFWLRLILDEVVETTPNNFLGKVHIRLFPGVAFSLGYFRLEK